MDVKRIRWPGGTDWQPLGYGAEWMRIEHLVWTENKTNKEVLTLVKEKGKLIEETMERKRYTWFDPIILLKL